MQRAAVVQRVQPGQFLATLGNRIGEGQQRCRAHLGLGLPPDGRRPRGRGDGGLDVIGIAARDLPMTSLVAGLITSRVAPETAPTRSPSTRTRLGMRSTGRGYIAAAAA